jgi:predicted transcriptional regulator of viral defense system
MVAQCVSLRYVLYTMPGRAFTALLNHAQQQYGYLTPDDARELDIDPTQLRLMAARHTLEHLGHGLYRMPMVPVTSLDAYMEAILWTGRRGVLSHETALDLYELCDVNPSAIHLTVPSGFRTRKAVPETYRLHRFDLDPAGVAWHESIPIVTPERAILGGIEQALGWQLIDQAIATARARGLITKPAAKRLAALRHRPQAVRSG